MGAFFHTLESQSPPSVDGVRMRWCLGLKGEFDTSPFMRWSFCLDKLHGRRFLQMII